MLRRPLTHTLSLTLTLTLTLTLFVCVDSATRPVLSEVFETRMWFDVSERNGERYGGQGLWVADQPNGENLEVHHFERESHLETYRLQRFDLGKEISLTGDDRTCDVRALHGEMPMNWGWVNESRYVGKEEKNGRASDVWLYSIGFATLQLGVDTANPNLPHFLRRNSSTTDVTYFFESWNTSTAPGMFDIPKNCSAIIKSTLACRERSAMMEVAKKWVEAKVPYNQHATHDGYREDCSGFVSACWALPKPGPDTEEFHKYAHKITKSELKEGDCLLFAAEHVVLFGGWTSSAHTHYTAYEETQPGEGTVKRETPYPYWYSQSSFIPYRYNNAC